MAHIPDNMDQMISILHNETGVTIPVEIQNRRSPTTGTVRKKESLLEKLKNR
jgi:hypothetical protein